MVAQGDDAQSFGTQLRAVLRRAGLKQRELAEKLHVHPSQVSRWVRNEALPTPEHAEAMRPILGEDLVEVLSRQTPEYEVYVSAPILGLPDGLIAEHHDKVKRVVDSLQRHVHSIYWPGADILSTADLDASDVVAERNLKILAKCPAFLYLQFSDLVKPSSSLIELGIALGDRIKTTIVLGAGVQSAYMLRSNFSMVAERLSFLPDARVYNNDTLESICDLFGKSGRKILGLS